MKQLPFVIKEGDQVTGRFGRHTMHDSPDWEQTVVYPVEHVQYNRKNEVAVVVIGGIEFGPENYEGTVDSQGKVHCFNAEDIIFEFTQ